MKLSILKMRNERKLVNIYRMKPVDAGNEYSGPRLVDVFGRCKLQMI